MITYIIPILKIPNNETLKRYPGNIIYSKIFRNKGIKNEKGKII